MKLENDLCPIFSDKVPILFEKIKKILLLVVIFLLLKFVFLKEHVRSNKSRVLTYLDVCLPPFLYNLSTGVFSIISLYPFVMARHVTIMKGEGSRVEERFEEDSRKM